jgi:hypothetical protein
VRVAYLGLSVKVAYFLRPQCDSHLGLGLGLGLGVTAA